MCSCGDQDHVGFKGPLTICSLGDHTLRAIKPAAPGHQGHVLAEQALFDIAGLSLREVEHSVIDRKQVDLYAGVDLPLIKRAEPHPQVGRVADIGHDLGCGDQGL
jgi:hypothetical protein